jgi:hypothetical protein
MNDQPQTWETYEQVAVAIMDKIAEHLGLAHVEGKQAVYGSRSGTDWEIDGKGVKVGDEGFIIIECRRYLKSRQKQEQVAALAYRIMDTGASGGILVSPLGFQEGARKVAAAENIQEFFMGPNSTRTDYVVKFLNQIFAGMSLTATPTLTATAVVRRADGTIKQSTRSMDE